MSIIWKQDYSGDLEVTTFLQSLSDGMDSLDSKFSSDTVPDTDSNRDWADTDNNLLKRRNNENTEWLIDGKLDEGMLYNDNILINGSFDVWQRNITFTISNSGSVNCADLWCCDNSSGSDVVVSKQVFTPGQTDVPGNPYYYCRVAKSGSSGRTHLYNTVPNVLSISGKSITISIYLKCDSSHTGGIRFFTHQVFGEGGSDAEFNQSNLIDVTTGWHRYSATIDLDTASGKTIGSMSYTRIGFLIESSATGTFDVTFAKAEEGNTFTKFINKNFNDVIYECLPFYQKSYSYEIYESSPSYEGAVWQVGSPSNSLIGSSINYQREMYNTPTVRFYSCGGVLNKVNINNSELNLYTPGFGISNPKSFRIYVSDGSLHNLNELSFQYAAEVTFI